MLSWSTCIFPIDVHCIFSSDNGNEHALQDMGKLKHILFDCMNGWLRVPIRGAEGVVRGYILSVRISRVELTPKSYHYGVTNHLNWPKRLRVFKGFLRGQECLFASVFSYADWPRYALYLEVWLSCICLAINDLHIFGQRVQNHPKCH